MGYGNRPSVPPLVSRKVDAPWRSPCGAARRRWRPGNRPSDGCALRLRGRSAHVVVVGFSSTPSKTSVSMPSASSAAKAFWGCPASSRPGSVQRAARVSRPARGRALRARTSAPAAAKPYAGARPGNRSAGSVPESSALPGLKHGSEEDTTLGCILPAPRTGKVQLFSPLVKGGWGVGHDLAHSLRIIAVRPISILLPPSPRGGQNFGFCASG